MDNEFQSFQNSQYFSIRPDELQHDTFDEDDFHVFNNQPLQKSLHISVTPSTKLQSSLLLSQTSTYGKMLTPRQKDHEQPIKDITPHFNETADNSLGDLSLLRKMDKPFSAFQQKSEYSYKSNWLNESELRCTLQYGNEPTPTICRTKNRQLQFANGYAFDLSNITKIKVAFEGCQKSLLFTYWNCEVELKFRVYIQNDVKDQIYLLFSKVIVEKLQLLRIPIDLMSTEQDTNELMMEGEIYKLSQVIKKWNKRKVVITDRIQSFKGNKCTFSMNSIRQVWSRFDTHNNCLVVKIRHVKGKTELAIPIMNYCLKMGRQNWLYRIYKLISFSVA